MQQRRCVISGCVLARDYGKNLTIGQIVDLDERLPSGGTLADHVRPEWFGPITEPQETPIPTIDPETSETDATPETPAEEDFHG